jgi:hypothetical protein
MRRSTEGQLMSLISLGDGSTLTLDFTTGVLDSRLTFTRASTGTFINASGNVATASNNVARFDHDPTTLAPRGLLVEAQATNVLTYSEQFNTAPWTAFSGSITANDGVAPDGNTTADSITPSVVNGGVYFSNSFAAGTWTFSVWAKANTGNTLTISIDNSSNGRAVAITLSTATAGTPFVRGTGGTVSSLTVNGVTVFQNSWVRISLTVVTTGANFVAMYNANDTNKILVWGAMLETGSGASSYISTGASQATRNQDQMQMTNLASLGFNTSAGTMTINGTYNKDANAFPRSIRFMGSSVQSMAMITAGKTLYGNAPNTSGATYFDVFRTLSSFGAFKYGFTLTTATSPATALAVVSLNGSSTTITPLGQGDIVNPISLDFLYPSGSALNFPSMNISSLKYWPYAMTGTQLNAMTA